MIGASAVGTMIEWYDFYIFGSLAATIAPLFYPPENQTFAYIAYLATFAVERDGKAVCFVADGLHYVQNWGVMVEDDGLILLSMNVDDLFAFSDRGQRLAGDL